VGKAVSLVQVRHPACRAQRGPHACVPVHWRLPGAAAACRWIFTLR
jgi:hypothetical protein